MMINAIWLLAVVPASALLGILVLTFVLIAHGDLGEKTERKARKHRKQKHTEPAEPSETVEQTATETHNASNSVGMVD